MELDEGTNRPKPQSRLISLVLTLLSVLLIYQVCCYFADLLRILGVSILLAYLVINIVDFLEPNLRSRAASILVVYAGLVLLAVVGSVLMLPAIVYQVTQLIQTTFASIPTLVQYLNHLVQPLAVRLHAVQIDVRTADILSSIISNIPRPDPSLIFARMGEVAMSTMTWALYAISIFVVSFYLLLDGHRLKNAVIKMFPKTYHDALHLMASDMDDGLQAFFRGQIVLGLLSGIVMLGLYTVMGVRYALLLSVFLGFWEIVPVIGPPIGFFPAIVSVAIHGMDNLPGNRLIQILIVTLIFNVLQQIKDNVLAPRYIGNVIGLHPIMIFIAIMIGARLDGILGIIFALPAACVINVLVNHLPLARAKQSPETARQSIAPVSLADEPESEHSAKGEGVD